MTKLKQNLFASNELQNISEISFMDGIEEGSIIDCIENNPMFAFHCKRLHARTHEISYNCTEDSSIEANYDHKSIANTFVFCDGIKNCKNGIDEQNCPQMFYCKSDQQPIPKDLTCDSTPDCADSSDECNNCTMTSFFSSQANLIGHDAMLSILMSRIRQ